MSILRADLDVLLDPLSDLRRQRAEYAWESHSSLRLDDRYRTRQLPLLQVRTWTAVGPESVAPGEFWPPVRSVVVPLPDDILNDQPMASFLAELRASEVAPLIWFEGLLVRAGRMHATLVPEVSLEGPDQPPHAVAVQTDGRGLKVVVKGPWVGRFNTGRIYLPVQAADEESAKALAAIRTLWGAEHRPLLAGFLQLRDDVNGRQYAELRHILAKYQTRLAIPVTVTELALMETMDDLVLRSRVVGRISMAVTR